MNQSKTYSIQELAQMSSVTVRTLRHYDEIGLLTPTGRNASGHREYGTDELLRLQQILIYKELGLPLQNIAVILDNPQFDVLKALKEHKVNVQNQVNRLSELLKTIDNTILHVTKEVPMTDEELYKGLSKEKAERYRKEAVANWGEEKVVSSEKTLKSMGKEGFDQYTKDMGDVFVQIAELMKEKVSVEEERVQKLIAQHHELIEKVFKAPADLYAGLADGYADNDEFRAHFEQYASNFADFLRDAMKVYAKENL